MQEMSYGAALCRATAKLCLTANAIAMSVTAELPQLQPSFLLKNAVFWDVTPCGPCKNRRFGGT
jgi:hypothetical protein